MLRKICHTPPHPPPPPPPKPGYGERDFQICIGVSLKRRKEEIVFCNRTTKHVLKLEMSKDVFYYVEKTGPARARVKEENRKLNLCFLINNYYINPSNKK